MKASYHRLLEKLAQPSTWKGLIAMSAAVGLAIDPARADAIVAAALTVIGLIQVVVDEG